MIDHNHQVLNLIIKRMLPQPVKKKKLNNKRVIHMSTYNKRKRKHHQLISQSHLENHNNRHNNNSNRSRRMRTNQPLRSIQKKHLRCQRSKREKKRVDINLIAVVNLQHMINQISTQEITLREKMILLILMVMTLRRKSMRSCQKIIICQTQMITSIRIKI